MLFGSAIAILHIASPRNVVGERAGAAVGFDRYYKRKESKKKIWVYPMRRTHGARFLGFLGITGPSPSSAFR